MSQLTERHIRAIEIVTEMAAEFRKRDAAMQGLSTAVAALTYIAFHVKGVWQAIDALTEEVYRG